MSGFTVTNLICGDVDKNPRKIHGYALGGCYMEDPKVNRSSSMPLLEPGRTWGLALAIEEENTPTKVSKWVSQNDYPSCYDYDAICEAIDFRTKKNSIGKLITSCKRRPSSKKALKILELIIECYPHYRLIHLDAVKDFFNRIPDSSFKFSDLKTGLRKIGYWK